MVQYIMSHKPLLHVLTRVSLIWINLKVGYVTQIAIRNSAFPRTWISLITLGSGLRPHVNGALEGATIST